jgi:hypothetical protein
MKKFILFSAFLFSSFAFFSCSDFVEGVRQSNNDAPVAAPAAPAPISQVGNDFVNSAVEILSDYKDYQNGNTGWLYTLEKGLHAYSTVAGSVADAKAALQPFIASKGSPVLDRLMALLQKKPDVPLSTKMAALAGLADSVAADKGP